MGDMGDLFNDLKDMRRTRAQQRVAEFQEKRKDIEASISAVVADNRSVVNFDIDASGTFNVRLFSSHGIMRKGSTIQFYPTKGTWQVKGRMWHGGVDAFETWITKTLRKVL